MMRWILLLTCLFTAAAPAAELTVATFNIRYASRGDRGNRSWEKRKDLVVETIRKMNPDVFGVQEALALQMDYLAGRLPGYETFGVGRDDGESKGEYSAIFVRKERLERDLKECGTFWLSNTPEKAGSKGWGNQVIRICTWARLVDKKTGQGFYFFNTHWDHRNQPSREKAGRLIAARADGRAKKDEAVVVTGDFNATETNPGVAYLIGQKVKLAGGEGLEKWKTPLRSTFLELHPEVVNRRSFNGWIGNKEGPHMIDHVLVSKGWKTKKAWIEYHHKDGIWPSDHFPVAAVIELAREEAK
jgi:endonuclease/exonuclease/phosphatase family metal-dependent hydrolase